MRRLREERRATNGLTELAKGFHEGQSVWPIISCNGKKKLGARREVTRVKNGRVFANAPGQPELDYHPDALSTKGP